MAAIDGLIALFSLSGTSEQNARKLTWFKETWRQDAAIAGTTALAEQAGGTVKQKSRLIGAKLITGTATTANGTNFFTLLIDKRTAAVPGTPVNVITFAADTPTTDDLAAFTAKDLVAYFTATAADLNFAEGDSYTVEVTKTGGSGLAFPIAQLELIFEARD